MYPVWVAFWTLHRERFGDMGIRPIGAVDVNAYLDLHGVEGAEARAQTYALVTAMDRAYFEWRDEDKES